MNKPLLDVLWGQRKIVPPIWFMRQAGRHLPEYLKLRSQAQDFLDFCYSPKLAIEATIQPIRRYSMDGAILFADILLLPQALGRSVEFQKGIGPVLEPILPADIKKLQRGGPNDKLANIYQTVSGVKKALTKDGFDHTALIGFCGAPWTVATYMIEGRGSTSKEKAKRFALAHESAMDDLLDILTVESADYLINQANAGAEVLKIFESWAEGLPPALFNRLVVRPAKKIVSIIRAAGIQIPIIGFPRGSGFNALKYAQETGINCLAVGTQMDIAQLRPLLPANMPVQGNLDPLVLRIGGKTLADAVDKVLAQAAGGPHIFNLGHGVAPDVKIENVKAVVRHVRTGEANYE